MGGSLRNKQIARELRWNMDKTSVEKTSPEGYREGRDDSNPRYIYRNAVKDAHSALDSFSLSIHN